jgi:catalase-peroxidase
MGLIYVNPEGPNGKPDPLASAKDIRETFARMAMNDEETVALIAGGHTFGKTHGAATRRCRPRARGRGLEEQGLGWKSSSAAARADRHDHQRPRGRLDPDADPWDNNYFETLFGYEWELTRARPAPGSGRPRTRPARVPDAHDPSKRHAPMMTTADMAMRVDPAYEKISRRFLRTPSSSPTPSPAPGSS